MEQFYIEKKIIQLLPKYSQTLPQQSPSQTPINYEQLNYQSKTPNMYPMMPYPYMGYPPYMPPPYSSNWDRGDYRDDRDSRDRNRNRDRDRDR